MRFSACMLIASALTLSAQTAPGLGVNLYSREKEAAVGAQIALEIRRSATTVDNAAALAYVQQMGAKLAAQFPEPRFPFTFAILAAGDAQQEPVALPGGYVFVPASLFLTAQDDSEFAGMLAHAMAHVVARHGTRAASQNAIQLDSMVTIPANGAPATAIPASFVNFSPVFEGEADILAVNTVSAAGYEAQGLIRYLNRQRADAGRIAGLQRAIQNVPRPSPEFLQIQRQLRN